MFIWAQQTFFFSLVNSGDENLTPVGGAGESGRGGGEMETTVLEQQ